MDSLDAVKEQVEETTSGVVRELLDSADPEAILHYGSSARLVQGVQNKVPNDVDLLYVGRGKPVVRNAYPLRVEVNAVTPERLLQIARSLRYDMGVVMRAKILASALLQRRPSRLIDTSFLLGSLERCTEYGLPPFLVQRLFGRREGVDYTAHRVLHGKGWWEALQAHAQEWRGPLGYVRDWMRGQTQFAFTEKRPE